MSQTVTLNGVSYTVPDPDDTGWGTYLTSYLTAIASNMLQKSGGSFNLTNDVDFGSTKGIISAYYKTSAGSLPSVGAFRLGNTDAVTWKGVSSDMSLVADSSTDGILNYNSVAIVTVSATQTLTNKTLTSPVINGATLGGLTQIEFEGSTPDDYETILTAAEPTADATVTIPNATTTLVGTDTAQTITNKRINSPKLNEDVALTATSTYLNRVDATSSIQTQLDAKQATIDSGNRLDASLVGTAGTVSNTEYDYLSTVTSNIQTQLDAKQATIDASNRLDADLIHDGSVSNTEFGYINSLTSNAQTQLDAKAPLSNPNFTGYADFDTITAPGAPGTSGQTRVYSNSGKLYFQGNGDASPTEIGSGGGAGDADTIQLKAANDFSAVDAAPWYTGKDEVPGGGGTLTGTWEISTSNPLINTDDKTNVFHYSNGGVDTKSSYFEIELDVPNYAKGHNLVTQLFYRTVGAEDTDFLFFARDRSGTYETTVNGSQSSVQTVTLASATGFSVGDRFCIGDSSGDRHFRYVTAVSSNDVSFSGSALSFSGGEAAVSKFFTDELNFITAENNTTNYEGKIRKWAFQINDTTTKIRVGFLYDNSATSTNELFFDQILLSSNQFLQTSSQGRSYSANYSALAGYGSANTAIAYYTNENYNNVPSEYATLTGTDSTNGFSIIANQNIRVEAFSALQASSGADQHVAWSKGATASELDGPVYSLAGSKMMTPIVKVAGNDEVLNVGGAFILEKGEIGYLHTDGSGWETGNANQTTNVVITPLVNDAVLLNSQDEIFTDWVSYTPTFNGFGECTTRKAVWRRNGSNMELLLQFTTGTVEASEAYFELPSGYSLDQPQVDDSGSDFAMVGKWTAANASAYDGFLMINAHANNPRRIFFTVTSGTYNPFDSRNGNQVLASTRKVTAKAVVPIQGWTSTFNPVLSMPLVNVGTDVEEIQAWGLVGSTAEAPRGWTNVQKNTASEIISVANISTAMVVTALQKCKIFASFTQAWSTSSFIWIVKNGNQTTAIDTSGNVNAESAGGYTNGGEPQCVAAEFVMQPNDTLYVSAGTATGQNTNKYRSNISITATKDRGNTNLAHIIKPAVCYFSERYANGEDGGNSGTNSWCQLYPNTFEGETWFIEGYNGSLGTDGDNWQFKLSPGMFEIWAAQPVYRTGSSRLRLRQQDDGIVYAQGDTQYAVNAYEGSATCNLFTTFTLTEAKYFTFQVWTATAQTSNGLGTNAYTPGGDEYYLTGYIRKLK